jgi:diguanylate cyclase (GGDEF)-like protein/PAS domain S-box-containing protein
MSRLRRSQIRPFVTRGRRMIVAILLTIALVSVVGVGLSIRETSRSQHQAAVVEVAARQRTLAQQYLSEVLLARAGQPADPAQTAALLDRSAETLLHGGKAPAVPGDDDETNLTAPTDSTITAQLQQARNLGRDLTGSGQALLAGRPVSAVELTAGEDLRGTGGLKRLRALTALSSNVSLNAARSLASLTDRNVSSLITTQALIGGIGLLVSLLLGAALIVVTRRQSTHFRSLVTSSTDLVMVFGDGGCLYASHSVGELIGQPEDELLGDELTRYVHPKDRDLVAHAAVNGEPTELVFRLMNRFGVWRHLEAVVTDLRADRHLRGVVLNARDISERLRLEEELTRQAFHDGLTGLPNRALFRDRLMQALTRATGSSSHTAVLLLDLDGFKQVNDSLGHGSGDLLLEAVARRFENAIDRSDTLARLGGDEFAVLIERADESEALAIGKGLIAELSSPFRIAGRELTVGCSVGAAVAEPGASNAEDLLRDADIAMYAAKEAGRGRAQLFRHEMAREFGELLGLEHELRTALQSGEMSVHFQREVTLDGEIIGAEALLRWTSRSRGSVPPDRFIPLAERNGMIFPLGEFVLRESCRQAAAWRSSGILPDGFTTWVNVSVHQLSAGGLCHFVEHLLAQSDLAPSMLGLEITESAIVEGAGGELAKRELEALHALGVRIAIDDFGTGFSALGQLRHMPIDMLKIDRSFVRGIENDPKEAAIVENLVNLAHTLGILAIAEGIETEGQLGVVRGLGCDLAQGYLFGRPAEPERLAEALSEAAPAAVSVQLA